MSVIVYSTPSCPWCHKVKDYLEFKEIRFKDINVAVDRPGAMEMIRKSGQSGVPVIDIDGNIVIGFDQSKIDMLLRRA
ncbi:glutaredoxin domain-containing protein [Lutispora saccharofermentans]|uniref:Glutathione S-transferase N-terminal domain-containing protein n=1 Tax=Lutispora saccharofermentans TaxID=3024236 RepID=A0ABT1NGD8_9FIRM|nr:glutaredoxin domain-containing protein [Lutispora saccharofermentans]MCQ1529669.1 glutathione S-transferase N-terminal domain-containing protein [Lutispora saccharofermentans]